MKPSLRRRWREIVALHCCLCHEEDSQRRQSEPDGYHNDGCRPVHGFLFVSSTACLFAALGQDGFRDHAYRQGHAEGDQEQVVQVPEYGDRVGDEVYRTEGIPDHDRGEDPGVGRHPGIPVGQIKRVDLRLESPRPTLQAPDGLGSQRPGVRLLMLVVPGKRRAAA
jgi:hypothetical protein